MIGAGLAGFIVGARKLVPGRRYGVALVCEGGLLVAAMALLLSGRRFGVPLIAMACGLQNATTSSYCGLMIRTTHDRHANEHEAAQRIEPLVARRGLPLSEGTRIPSNQFHRRSNGWPRGRDHAGRIGRHHPLGLARESKGSRI